jgi:hypothetical protein
MEKSQAIAIASEFIKNQGTHVEEVASVRKISACMLPEAHQANGDFWVVAFRRPVSEDVVESPDEVLVDVNDATGEPSFPATL